MSSSSDEIKKEYEESFLKGNDLKLYQKDPSSFPMPTEIRTVNVCRVAIFECTSPWSGYNLDILLPDGRTKNVSLLKHPDGKFFLNKPETHEEIGRDLDIAIEKAVKYQLDEELFEGTGEVRRRL